VARPTRQCGSGVLVECTEKQRKRIQLKVQPTSSPAPRTPVCCWPCSPA